jgi:hypothetical protein
MPPWVARFDAWQWAEPGERPDPDGCRRDDWEATWDYYRCHRRYTTVMLAWFDDHPDADIIAFLQAD